MNKVQINDRIKEIENMVKELSVNFIGRKLTKRKSSIQGDNCNTRISLSDFKSRVK